MLVLTAATTAAATASKSSKASETTKVDIDPAKSETTKSDMSYLFPADCLRVMVLHSWFVIRVFTKSIVVTSLVSILQNLVCFLISLSSCSCHVPFEMVTIFSCLILRSSSSVALSGCHFLDTSRYPYYGQFQVSVWLHTLVISLSEAS